MAAADVPLLSQGWLDLQRELTADLPERPGASATIEYRIAGGPDGEVVFHTVLEDGRIATNQLGAVDDPDFTVLMPHAEFVDVVRGELDQNVGFMQGRVKVTGNIGRMLSVLPVTTSEAWRAASQRLLAATAL
ncbi:MAG: SCP2 sterol-binding domain-containing protein [Acidimicrobiia bacterium]|jgi:putative sterol carrier protein